MRDYRNIKAYKISDQLVVEIYRTSKGFPKEELYGLTSQLRRAAISVPSNIVEGSSRSHNKEYLQFLYISRGSLAETEYLLNIAARLGYLNEEEYLKIDTMLKGAAKTLYGLIKSVEKEP